MSEQAITFDLAGQQLIGIIHQGAEGVNAPAKDTAVLIVVGGPQYRVGSHRQFIQLARALARNGITTMRFDYRGMGDSEGEKAKFDDVCSDIKAAIDTLMQQQSQIKKVIIWGLCDAASAALIYAHQDPRVSGLVLLNPWLTSEQAMGKTMVKYYYVQRLLSRDFWRKLLTGKVNVAASARDAKGFVADSVKKDQKDDSSYQARMLTGLHNFSGKLCLILSGADLTAREFDQQTSKSKSWKKLRAGACQTHRLTNADHTFSSAKFKREVEHLTIDFIDNICS